MALRKLNAQIEAFSMGNKKGETKTVSGYLIGAKYEVGKTVKKGKVVKKGNTIFHFVDKKNTRFDVWGNASIINALCIDDKLNPSIGNQFTRIDFVKIGKAKPGQNAPKICDVFTDDADKLKRGIDFASAAVAAAKNRTRK